MDKQFYTYLHCKPDGTPFYVGKGHDARGKIGNKFCVGHKQSQETIQKRINTRKKNKENNTKCSN